MNADQTRLVTRVAVGAAFVAAAVLLVATVVPAFGPPGLLLLFAVPLVRNVVVVVVTRGADRWLAVLGIALVAVVVAAAAFSR